MKLAVAGNFYKKLNVVGNSIKELGPASKTLFTVKLKITSVAILIDSRILSKI